VPVQTFSSRHNRLGFNQMHAPLVAFADSGRMPFLAVWAMESALRVGQTAAEAGLSAHLSPQPLGRYPEVREQRPETRMQSLGQTRSEVRSWLAGYR